MASWKIEWLVMPDEMENKIFNIEEEKLKNPWYPYPNPSKNFGKWIFWAIIIPILLFLMIL